MKIASPKLHTAHLTRSEEALLRCKAALERKEKGDYEGAIEAMRPLWAHVGAKPDIAEFHASTAAEVLLCAGILTGWIGSKTPVDKAQENAKNLLTESIRLFETLGDVTRIAATRVELAYCYWRDGELNEARIMLLEALDRLMTPGITRAKAMLKLTTVENSAGRFNESLAILTDNASLFEKLNDKSTKGTYHNQLAITLDLVGASENRNDYFIRAVSEYKAADDYFRVTKNPVYRASVKNNVGLLLFKLNRYKEAHKYLVEARRLAVSFGDKARVAQFDETRAQFFLAEKKYKDAEATARSAAKILEKIGHQCLMIDALITQSVALARWGKTLRAHFILQKAIDVAIQVQALNKAGLAALTMIEEITDMPLATAHAAYQQADEWLTDAKSQDILLRLNAAAKKLAILLRGELSEKQAKETLLAQGCDFHIEVLEFERKLIREALARTSGRITHAARLLALSYQGLGYIIASRHPDLLKERSPVRHRKPPQK